MTVEKTRRKCERDGCTETFRRNVSRGRTGRPQRYCTEVCRHLAERAREKASVRPRRRREYSRRVAEEKWSWD